MTEQDKEIKNAISMAFLHLGIAMGKLIRVDPDISEIKKELNVIRDFLNDLAYNTSGTRIDQCDLYLMLGGAIRYSLPRQTYMSGQCAEWCEEYASVLTSDQRASFIRDIKQEIDKTSSIDRPQWEAALKSLESPNVN